MSAAPPATPQEPDSIAADWFSRLLALRDGMPQSFPAPAAPDILIQALVQVCAIALEAGERLLVVTPDDQLLPEISNQLDLALRPLCLVLPGSPFTAPIALRASLSLLRSRLARDADGEAPAPWARQRAHLDEDKEAWQTALDWSASDTSAPWPEKVSDLFPVCIVPLARRHQADGFANVISLGHLDPAIAGRSLILVPPPASAAFLGALVEADPEVHVRAEMEAVAQEIADMELELATVQGELAEFTHRYHDKVGSRISILDQLQAELALKMAARAPDDAPRQEEAEAARAKADRSRQDEERYRRAAKDEEQDATPFRPPTDLKKLFRQVAQKIHPDRARNEADRHWRTRLMAEANRAYRAGDSATLREVLSLWQEQGQGNGESPAGLAAGTRNMRQLDRLRQRMGEIQRELNRLFGSRLYELFLAERMARRACRELLDEMAAKLDAQIAATQLKLSELD